MTRPCTLAVERTSDTRRPWRPRVAGLVGLFFGPLAAAFVTFINLRRMARPREAGWVLGLTLVAVPLVGLLNHLLGFGLLGLFPLSAALYPRFQRDEDVAARRYAPAWKAALWGPPGLLALVLFGVDPWVRLETKVEDIDVAIVAPDAAVPGERYGFEVRVRNQAGAPQVLRAIELQYDLFEVFEIDRSDPPFAEAQDFGLGILRKFLFHATLAPGEELDVRLEGVLRGTVPSISPVGICIRTIYACEYHELIAVTAP